jgi:hypothetical protein
MDDSCSQRHSKMTEHKNIRMVMQLMCIDINLFVSVNGCIFIFDCSVLAIRQMFACRSSKMTIRRT